MSKHNIYPNVLGFLFGFFVGEEKWFGGVKIKVFILH